MTITEFPPQRRTLVTSIRTYYIYLPKIIFIEPSQKSIVLVYEYQNKWFSFSGLLPNIEGNHICFHKVKEKSIDSFWNTLFQDSEEYKANYKELYNRLSTPDWWKTIKYDSDIYNHLACCTNNLDLLKLMIQKGASDYYRISIAVTNGNRYDIMEYLIKHKKNFIDINSIFRQAIFAKSIDIIELLFDKISVSQEDINKYAIAMFESKRTRLISKDVLDLLFQHGANNYDECLKEIEKIIFEDIRSQMKNIVLKHKEKNNGNY